MLPDTLPLIKRMVPPAPAVMLGGPVMRMLPPVVVPAAALLPALSSIAVEVALVVATFCATVISPLSVSTRTSPLALIPVVAPTVSTESAPAFTNVKPLTPVAAKVLTMLLV